MASVSLKIAKWHTRQSRWTPRWTPYLASESGRVSIVKAAPEWEPVADIDLNEEIYATPAFVNGYLYLRTMSTLYCFARP